VFVQLSDSLSVFSLVIWSVGHVQLVGLVGRLVSWSVGHVVSWSCSVGRLVSWSVGQLVSRSVGQFLVGRLVSWSVG